MKKLILPSILPLIALAAFSPPARAVITLPFTEDFDANNSNWTAPSFLPLNWISSGGPNGVGDSYVSSAVNFAGSFENDNVLFARGHSSTGASDGAFVGDWLTAGVSEFSFWVRHDFTDPLSFFTRFATPINFPGVVGVSTTLVLPDTWTEITFSIDAANPLMFPEGPPGTFEAAFGDIGNLQFGLTVPLGLAGFASDVTFDLDRISIIPAPAGGLLFLTSSAFFSRGRRRRK